MITDVILENKVLMSELVSRFRTAKIGYSKLVEEMAEDGIVMDVKRLQRFINHGFQRRITQKAYIWLLLRHGLVISLDVEGLENATDEQNRLKAKQFTQ